MDRELYLEKIKHSIKSLSTKIMHRFANANKRNYDTLHSKISYCKGIRIRLVVHKAKQYPHHLHPSNIDHNVSEIITLITPCHKHQQPGQLLNKSEDSQFKISLSNFNLVFINILQSLFPESRLAGLTHAKILPSMEPHPEILEGCFFFA